MRTILLLVPVLLASTVAAHGQEPAIAFVGATVVRMDGSPPLADGVVLVRGDRIVAVGPRDSVAFEGAEVVDASGRWMIPGLWDMHVHALYDPALVERLLALTVANGVTGIRDMGGRLDVLADVRARARSGELLAPRIVAAGPILDGPGSPSPEISWILETPEEAPAAVDSLAAAGVDFIKVYSLLSRPVFFAIAGRAREIGMPIAGHVPIRVAPADGARAGMRSIEHLKSEVAPYCTRTDPEACDEPIKAFLEEGTWQTPTLAVRRNRAFLRDSTAVWKPYLRYAPRALLDEWGESRNGRLDRSAAYWSSAREQQADEMFVTGLLNAAGVPILAGSDAGALYSLHGFTLHDELELLVQAGLEPEAALRAATADAARFLGAWDSIGSIAIGKKADLVLLDADPLEDIGNTRRIRAVVLNGRLLRRRDLDRLLEDGS